MGAVHLSGRQGQALALLLLLLSLSVAWAVLIGPALALFDEREVKLSQESFAIDHLAAQAADLPRLRAAWALRPSGDGPQNYLIAGATQPLAAATLQNQIEALAAAAGVVIESVEPLPAGAEGSSADTVGVLIRTDCSYAALMHLLSAIRLHTPVLSVDQFELHATGDTAAAASFASSFTVRAPWVAGGLK